MKQNERKKEKKRKKARNKEIKNKNKKKKRRNEKKLASIFTIQQLNKPRSKALHFTSIVSFECMFELQFIK